MTRTISKVAKELDINIETVRFYELRGLIAQPPKPEHGWSISLAVLEKFHSMHRGTFYASRTE